MARVVRALSRDAQIRMAVVDARPLWDGIRRGHPHLEAQACACLTELLAAALLLQSRTLFSERLQILMRSAGRAKALVADSWPDGLVRGMLDSSDEVERGPFIHTPGIFQVMRSGPKGEPFVGKLDLVEGDIATQVEYYLQKSEQIQASLSLWCDSSTGDAGGLLVEPLPGCPRERIKRLVDAIEGLEVVPHWERDPEFLFRWFNQGEGSTLLSTYEIEYRCRCSQRSLLGTLASFPAEQLAEVFHGEDAVAVRCEYCGMQYRISKEELSGLQGTPSDLGECRG
jgi:molecular chaperone Hsp33